MLNSILYIGSGSCNSTSFHRASALQRLGYYVNLLDPYNIFQNTWNAKFHCHTGYRLVQSLILNWLAQKITDLPKPDLIWVNSGELLGSASLILLKKFNVPIVLYNNDDPTGWRDGKRFSSLIQALPFYDLCVVMREINEVEYLSYGARRILRVWMSYDELIHYPSEFLKCKDDIAFIGTYRKLEGRDKFLLDLIRSDFKVSIWGAGWEKSPLWPQLKFYCHGPAQGSTYSQVCQSSSFIIGFLSTTNRDLHTRRSIEVPASGGVLCAERTSEHQLLFEEGREAIFWSSVAECIEICRYFLNHPQELEEIRNAGIRKVRQMGVGNEDICRQILAEINL